MKSVYNKPLGNHKKLYPINYYTVWINYSIHLFIH